MAYNSLAHMLKLTWFQSIGQISKQYLHIYLHHLHILPPKDRINVLPFQCLLHSWCSKSGKRINKVSLTYILSILTYLEHSQNSAYK